jgi:hypothetical protein
MRIEKENEMLNEKMEEKRRGQTTQQKIVLLRYALGLRESVTFLLYRYVRIGIMFSSLR